VRNSRSDVILSRHLSSLPAILLLCLVGGASVGLAGEDTIAGAERSPCCTRSTPSERVLPKKGGRHPECIAGRHRSDHFCLSSPAPDPAVLNGAYTNPNTGTINGVPTDVISDDFFNDVLENQSWKIPGTLGNFTGPGVFGNGAGGTHTTGTSNGSIDPPTDPPADPPADPPSQNCCGPSLHRELEVVSTPEPPPLATLAIDLLVLVAVLLLLRRRRTLTSG
jgi:hypothetical protein